MVLKWKSHFCPLNERKLNESVTTKVWNIFIFVLWSFPHRTRWIKQTTFYEIMERWKKVEKQYGQNIFDYKFEKMSRNKYWINIFWLKTYFKLLFRNELFFAELNIFELNIVELFVVPFFTLIWSFLNWWTNFRFRQSGNEMTRLNLKEKSVLKKYVINIKI